MLSEPASELAAVKHKQLVIPSCFQANKRATHSPTTLLSSLNAPSPTKCALTPSTTKSLPLNSPSLSPHPSISPNNSLLPFKSTTSVSLVSSVRVDMTTAPDTGSVRNVWNSRRT